MKPLIGITANFSDDDKYFIDKGLGAIGQNWSAVANDYADAIIRSGALPIIIPLNADQDYNMEIIKRLDGFIFSGGADMDPMHSGQRADRKTGRVSALRDTQELFLIDNIYKSTNKPILGICRGFQLMNVYFGGTLIMDLPTAGYLDHGIVNNERFYPTHSVEIVEGSLLEEIIGSNKTYVNTLHHQAVDKLAENLIVSAKSEDLVIEAAEHRNIKDRFIMGVQWHPEMLSVKDDKQQNIFDYFVKECNKN